MKLTRFMDLMEIFVTKKVKGTPRGVINQILIEHPELSKHKVYGIKNNENPNVTKKTGSILADIFGWKYKVEVEDNE